MRRRRRNFFNIADGTHTEFVLDHRNRLVRAEQRASGGELLLGASYEYDLFDRRIGKVVDSDGDGLLAAESERYWYSADQIWADLDASDNIPARYLHGALVDEIMARG